MKGENNGFSIRLKALFSASIQAQPGIYYDNINYDGKYVTK